MERQTHNPNGEPYEWWDSAGNGLTIDEMDDLAHNLVNNVERVEHEDLNRLTELYLKWGKWLVDHGEVSDDI